AHKALALRRPATRSRIRPGTSGRPPELCHHRPVHVSIAQWMVLAATVVAASTVQGVVGFGSNLLAVPVVALIVPSALPGAMVIPGVPMAVAMALAERDHVDWRGSRYLVLGRLPGTLVGVGVVAAVSSDTLAVLIGVVVLLGVALSVVASHL